MSLRKPLLSLRNRLARGVWVRRPLRRLIFALRYRFGPRKPLRPVFVVSEQRTGSSLLGCYLDSLPEASFAGEVLGVSHVEGLPRRVRSREGALRHLAHTFNALPGELCGAKLMCDDLKHRDLTLEDVREAFPQGRFIVIYRKSLAEQFVSHMLAKRTQVWRLTRVKAEAPRVKLRLRRKRIERYYRQRREAMESLLERPWLRERAILLSYEELTADPQKVFGEIVCPFLGVKSVEVNAPLRKMNRRPLSESVENYEEVEDLLTGPAAWHSYRLDGAAPGGPIGEIALPVSKRLPLARGEAIAV